MIFGLSIQSFLLRNAELFPDTLNQTVMCLIHCGKMVRIKKFLADVIYPKQNGTSRIFCTVRAQLMTRVLLCLDNLGTQA